MTDDPRRFFFVHVMKTGGTTLAMHMARQFEPAEIYPNEALDRRSPTDVESYMSIDALLRLPPERTAAIRAYTGHFPFVVSEQIGPDVETFTLLRDPVERSISSLKHFKRLYERYHALSLDEIYDDAFVFRHFVHNHQTKVFAVTAEDRPESIASTLTHDQLRAYLEGRNADPEAGRATPSDTIVVDDTRLALAKQRLSGVDVVGVSEGFAAFMQDLRNRYGWWPALGSAEGRANVSTESWDASTALRARIERDNRFDRELYAHAQEIVAQHRG